MAKHIRSHLHTSSTGLASLSYNCCTSLTILHRSCITLVSEYIECFFCLAHGSHKYPASHLSVSQKRCTHSSHYFHCAHICTRPHSFAQVFSHFVKQYARGATPNPDLPCNRFIKFGALLQAAQTAGAQAVATGGGSWFIFFATGNRGGIGCPW